MTTSDASLSTAPRRFSPGQRFAIRLALIAAAALVVRVVYVITFSSHLHFGLDTVWYQLEAGALADGRGYVDPHQLYSAGRAVPTAFRPPVYPGFLALVIELIGDRIRTFQLVGCVTGAASVALIGVLGRRIGGDGVGITAAVLAACSPALIGYDASVMSESLYVPLVTTLLLAVYAARRAPTPMRWGAVGIVAGLCILTRGDALMLTAIVVVGGALLLRLPAKRRGALGLMAILGVLLVVGPWIVRNDQQVGRPTVATLDVGTALAGTNCAAVYGGAKLGSWEFACTQRKGQDQLSEVELNDRLQRDGLQYLRDHTTRVPVVVPARILRLWGLWSPVSEARLEADESRNLSWQMITWATSLLTFVAAGFGFRLLVRARGEWGPLAATLASITIAAALSYGKQRFRAAAEPALIVAAAVAVAHWLDRLRSKTHAEHRARIRKAERHEPRTV